MADFDLSLVVRAKDEGASATGKKLESAIDGVARAQTRSKGASDNLRGSTTATAGAEDKAALAAARLAAANDRAALAAAKLKQANDRLASGMGSARSNMAGFGAQVQDITSTLALGINPFTVFMQQAGQTAAALQNTTGKAGQLARFLAGPLGSAVIATVGILGLLATSSKKAAEANEELGDGIDFASKSAKELIKSIGELDKAQGKAVQTTYESERAKYADAAAALAAARANRELAKSELERAIGLSAVAAAAGSDGVADAEVAKKRALIAELDASIGSAESLERNAAVPIIRRRIAAATDEAAAATLRYDEAEKKLRDNYLKTGDLKTYTNALRGITEQREKDMEAARKANRQSREAFDGKSLASFGDPVRNANSRITSPFGDRKSPIAGASTNHKAIDYAAQMGEAIFATMDGVIKRAATAGGYGNQVQIDHGAGTQTRYSHLSRFNVADGQAVQKGDVIGFAGKTGTATGTHLHYEVLVNGKKVDPKGGRFPFDPAEVEDAAQRSADTLQTFGNRASESIARIGERFNDQPRLIDAAAQSVRQLDGLIAELSEKKPPNFKELIADAEAAKVAVVNGINKPYQDFIRSQGEALQVQRLITAGRGAEAEALRIILDLERQSGPLTAAKKAEVLETVKALRAEGRQVELNTQKQQKYLDQLHSVKDAVRAIFSDPVEGLKDLPKRLIAAANQFRADEMFENLFGETFQKLEDRITGADAATESAERLGKSVDTVTASAQRVTAAFNDVATAAVRGAVDPLAPNPALPDPANDNADTAVVIGKRLAGLPQILEKLSKGIGISDAGAKKIGKYAIDAMVIGQGVANVVGALRGAPGAGGGRVGNAIGAAMDVAGQYVPQIAIARGIGQAAASLFGKKEFAGGMFGAIGNILFGKKIKVQKGSTIVSGIGEYETRHSRVPTSGLGRSVSDGVQGIADTLGGGTSSFGVGIGVRDGKFVVDTAGKGDTKGANVRSFDDEAAAVSFAIADAIKDGAVTGLSEAVKKALASSDDIDQGLREALKVKQLEILIGGIGGKLKDEFQRFDAMAAERVRLAKKYGLDLVAVERINAEERAKIVADMITSRVGALQDFQKSMLFGDLFEGDAPTRRAAILGEIGTTQTQAEAGVDGAADRLADLYRQLIDTSKEAFGTAGPELASDRALATAGVDRVIAMETARIDEARAFQDAQLAAANQNNVLTNETNDLLAQLVAASRTPGLDAAASGGGFVGGILNGIGRQSNVRVA